MNNLGAHSAVQSGSLSSRLAGGVSTNELLNLGTNGTVLTVNALTINTTNYTKGGTYTTNNNWNGYGNPGANVTGDGAIYLVTSPIAAGADRGDPGEALQTRSDREEPRLGVSRDSNCRAHVSVIAVRRLEVYFNDMRDVFCRCSDVARHCAVSHMDTTLLRAAFPGAVH